MNRRALLAAPALLGIGPIRPSRAQDVSAPAFGYPIASPGRSPGRSPGDSLIIRHGDACENTWYNPAVASTKRELRVSAVSQSQRRLALRWHPGCCSGVPRACAVQELCGWRMSRSDSHSSRAAATVDGQRRPGDVVGKRGAEQEDSSGDIRRFAGTSER